jgi:hypothetical protein
MRRTTLLLAPVLALTTPTAALALREGAGDGTLSVSHANGMVIVSGHGSVLGRLGAGKIVVEDSDPNDGVTPVVNGADRTKVTNETTTSYYGSSIRFRIVGGSFRVKVIGTGIDLSTAGRGYATLGPDPANADTSVAGTYSLNGGTDTPVPAATIKLILGAATPG